MSDEIILLQNHLKDLAERSYRSDIYTFSPFLSLSEMDVYYRMERELSYAHPVVYGGYEEAERAIVRFGNPESMGYEETFPIVCVHIFPMMDKFAESLSHRDYLGALMNLGIERDVLGDIKTGEKEAFLFCQEKVAEFICENLTQVRHTHIRCKLVTEMSELPQEEPSPQVIQVSSPRVDAVISKVYNLSRNDSLELFRTGKVFVNGRLCENNSKNIAPGDVINARGYGKCKLNGEWNTTKKGKLSGQMLVYK